MYEKEVAEAKRRGLTVQEDGLPDASRVDCDLNYHLELVDLLGMCAKGRNAFTEEYCKKWFSEDDIFKVLGELFKAELARLEATDETAALTLSA